MTTRRPRCLSSTSEESFDSFSSDDSDAGKSFGEIALISEDAVRNASIIADEDTDLLVIDRSLFNGTLKAKQEAEYQERKRFVRKCELFRHWSSKFRRLCEMSLRKVSLPFDSVLLKQGDPVVGLHFIIRGQGKVMVDPNLHKSQFPKRCDIEAMEDEEDTDNIQQRKVVDTKVKDVPQREQVRVRRRQGYAAAEKRLNSKYVTMCYVDENEILGDVELVLGLDTYTHTVLCTTNTEVFILDQKNIERLIQKKHPHTMDDLRRIVEDKLRSRTCMRVGSQIPLYRQLVTSIDQSKPRRIASGKLKADQDEKPRTIAETVADRDTMVNHLSKMFIQDKVPFIEPRVPGSLYFLNKSTERAQKRATLREAQRKSRNTGRTGEVRLQRARRAAKRQPRSRRELEKLVLGEEREDIKQLQDNDHTINKYYSVQIGDNRPKSAIELTGRQELGGSLTQGEHSQTSGDQTHLGYRDMRRDSMKNIAHEIQHRSQSTTATRSKIICSMLEKKQDQDELMANRGRPKSAPAPKRQAFQEEQDPEEEDDNFDWESGNKALNRLEDRLRLFHAKHDTGDASRRTAPNVAEMKRFNIQGPENVPIPGGTVYVRQKACRFTSTAGDHQHVKRYIIPRDAYRVAVRSLSAMDSTQSQDRPTSRVSRASSANAAAPRAISTVAAAAAPPQDKHARIQSAPLKRAKAW